jgi:hypothetical protein
LEISSSGTAEAIPAVAELEVAAAATIQTWLVVAVEAS